MLLEEYGSSVLPLPLSRNPFFWLYAPLAVTQGAILKVEYIGVLWCILHSFVLSRMINPSLQCSSEVWSSGVWSSGVWEAGGAARPGSAISRSHQLSNRGARPRYPQIAPAKRRYMLDARFQRWSINPVAVPTQLRQHSITRFRPREDRAAFHSVFMQRRPVWILRNGCVRLTRGWCTHLV